MNNPRSVLSWLALIFSWKFRFKGSATLQLRNTGILVPQLPLSLNCLGWSNFQWIQNKRIPLQLHNNLQSEVKFEMQCDIWQHKTNQVETVRRVAVPPSPGFIPRICFFTPAIKKPSYFVNFATISILRGNISSTHLFGDFIIFSQRAVSSEVESIQSTVVP